MTATYTVLSASTRKGRRVWLELQLANTLGTRLSGATGGLVEFMTPGQLRRPVIEWGASSADDIAVGPKATSTKTIYTIRGDKLRTSARSRISLLGVYTFVAAPNGTHSCSLPARVQAPRNLSIKHPDGSWFLTVTPGERNRAIGFRRHL